MRAPLQRVARTRGTAPVRPSPGGRAAERGQRRDLDPRLLQAAIRDPSTAGPDAILQLQRIGGNRAVQRLLAPSGSRRLSRPSPSVGGALVAQRHAMPPRPGSPDDENAPLDEALQRTPAVQRDRSDHNIARGGELPELDKAITARLKSAFTDDPVFAADVYLRTLGKFESVAGNRKHKLAFEALRKQLRAIAARKSNDDPHELVAALAARVVPDPKKADDTVKAVLPSNTKVRADAARAAFDDSRGNFALGKAYLSMKKRKQFAKALKQLDVVRTLLTRPMPSLADVSDWRAGKADPKMAHWGENAPLSSKVVAKTSPDISSALNATRSNTAHLGAFKRKIDRVDLWLRSVLQPALMLRVKKLPIIEMHTQGRNRTLGSGRGFLPIPTLFGYRASGDRDKILLAYDEKVQVIAHEMGHAIEAFLPIGSWHDMNLLLERRHRKAEKSSRKAVGGANIATFGSEGRYAGTYSTGAYTSTAYKMEGNAEVFSMGMQFLAKPANAKTLIEDDPQHAAIILRAIRPDQYESLDALREFDRYLPQSTTTGGLGAAAPSGTGT